MWNVSRTEFESRPDRGLLGKSVLRHFNRLTNYVVKGALGSLLICTLFPLACIVVSYTSLLLALLAPLLIPCASLLLHLTAALVYDWETGRPTAALLPSLIVHLLLQGDDDDDGDDGDDDDDDDDDGDSPP